MASNGLQHPERITVAAVVAEHTGPAGRPVPAGLAAGELVAPMLPVMEPQELRTLVVVAAAADRHSLVLLMEVMAEQVWWSSDTRCEVNKYCGKNMPQNDPNIWAEIAAFFAATLSIVSAWIWKHTHGLISKKAETVIVDDLVQRFETAAKNSREDSQRIFDQIKEVTETHSAFAQKCIEEIGKRPTREECQIIWHKGKL